MIFCDELHYCPVCLDFVPYIPAIRGACCADCGRLFTESDEEDYRRHRCWISAEREERMPAIVLPVSFPHWIPSDAVAG